MSEFISGRRAGQRRTDNPHLRRACRRSRDRRAARVRSGAATAQAPRRLDRAAAEEVRRRACAKRLAYARGRGAGQEIVQRRPGCTRRSAPTAFGRRGTARSRCSRNERLPEAMRTMPGWPGSSRRWSTAGGRECLTPAVSRTRETEMMRMTTRPRSTPAARKRATASAPSCSIAAGSTCRRSATCPGKRAAFEILTQYPIDWERAARCEAQDDEPWRSPNMREPEMLLTAENGWMGDMVHGPDKKASLREALDKHHAEQGCRRSMWEGGGRNENEKPSRSEFVTSNDTPAAVAGRISASLDQADAALRADPLALGAPTMKSFSLNSREFYDAVCAPRGAAVDPQRRASARAEAARPGGDRRAGRGRGAALSRRPKRGGRG